MGVAEIGTAVRWTAMPLAMEREPTTTGPAVGHRAALDLAPAGRGQIRPGRRQRP